MFDNSLLYLLQAFPWSAAKELGPNLVSWLHDLIQPEAVMPLALFTTTLAALKVPLILSILAYNVRVRGGVRVAALVAVVGGYPIQRIDKRWDQRCRLRTGAVDGVTLVTWSNECARAANQTTRLCVVAGTLCRAQVVAHES